MKKEVLSQNFYSMSAHFGKASITFYHTNSVPYSDLTDYVSALLCRFCVFFDFILRGVCAVLKRQYLKMKILCSFVFFSTFVG